MRKLIAVAMVAVLSLTSLAGCQAWDKSEQVKQEQDAKGGPN